MARALKPQHEVPQLSDAEVAFRLLGLKSKDAHLPMTYVRLWRPRWGSELRRRSPHLLIRARHWPDHCKPSNYIVQAGESAMNKFSRQRINTNDGAKCLAKLLEIINE